MDRRERTMPVFERMLDAMKWIAVAVLVLGFFYSVQGRDGPGNVRDCDYTASCDYGLF